MKYSFSNLYRLFLAVLVTGILLSACKKEVTVNPAVNQIDPGSGAGGAVLTVTGSGLKDVQQILFDLGNVPADFNPNFNTDGAIIFRVPNAANVGDQNIIFINSSGYRFSVPFTVLAVPSVTEAFPAEWEAGSNITLRGNYLSTVDLVELEGTGETADVVSATATELVIQMPASAIKTTKLRIRNIAGTTLTDQVFLNMDQQLKFYTEGLGSGMQNWSWCTATSSTDFSVSGAESFKAVYAADGNQGLSFHYDFDLKSGDYSYLSFWVKGGTDDNEVKVNPDGIVAGPSGLQVLISVPSDKWTYFKIPISGNYDGLTFNRFNFQITGPTGKSQTLYFDNVLLVK